MIIKRNVIFYLVLVAEANICAMHRKSMFDIAYEQHMIQRKKVYENRGLPVPQGPTYEEALRMQLKCWAENERAIREGMTQQEEMRKKAEYQ